MIELGKKYKLKMIRGLDTSDNEYYKVIDFYNFDTIIYERVFNRPTKA